MKESNKFYVGEFSDAAQRAAEEEFAKLDFTSNFLFCKIMMKRPDLAAKVIRIITGIPIKDVQVEVAEYPIEITKSSRGIRLDIYAVDENEKVYDIEMQTRLDRNLPKRARYYQGMIDLDHLDRGNDFDELNETYVIFICLDDLFGNNLSIYHFENMCHENPEILLRDGAHKIFVNAKGDTTNYPTAFRCFCRYLITHQAEDELTMQIEQEVQEARDNRKWKREYMSMNCWEADIRAEGKAEELAMIVATLLRKGKTPEEIAELIDRPVEEIREAAARVANRMQ